MSMTSVASLFCTSKQDESNNNSNNRKKTETKTLRQRTKSSLVSLFGVPNNTKTKTTLTTKSKTKTSCFETRIGRALAACQWLPRASISCVPTRQTPSHITHQIHHQAHAHTHTHGNFSKQTAKVHFALLAKNQAVEGAS